METTGSGASRAGDDDYTNEDAFLAKEELGLYVVCDGAGSQPGGEIAARIAVTALEEFIEGIEHDFSLRAEREARAVVCAAMGCALSAVDDAEKEDPALLGLATTVTMLLIRGDRGVIGHRGDSRAYLIRRERALQLTIDDELTEEIPSDDFDDFDVFDFELRRGDTIVLCTDGAEVVMQNKEIVRIAGDLSPRLLASRIVSAAHRLHAHDDATAVVVRVLGNNEPVWFELSSLPSGTSFGRVIALA